MIQSTLFCLFIDAFEDCKAINMNDMKTILRFLCSASFLLLALVATGQTTVSYGQISSYCPQTGQTIGGGGAVSVTFYDNYIVHSMYGKLYESQRNYDGSITYLPNQFAGTPAMQLNAVLISSDGQRMEERITSSLGYASINMINTYTSMGVDGGRAASNWANAQAASKRGNSNSSRDRNSGTCRSCGGTGVNKTPNSGGSRTSWVAYYNSSGTQCPYCGLYNSHFHDKCASCNVPRN